MERKRTDTDSRPGDSDRTASEPAPTDARLNRAVRALRAVSQCHQLLVRATDEAALLDGVCRVLVEQGGYRTAWVGYAEQEEAPSVRPVAQAGFEEALLQRWAEADHGRSFVGTAIRTGQYVIARNIHTDPVPEPLREAPVQRGCAASIALPLRAENQTLGVLVLYAALPDAFDADEASLLAPLAENLACTITALRSRHAREQAEGALRESERLLAESQRLAHVGSWSLTLGTDRIEWTDETYRIFGVSPETFVPTVASFRNLVHPEDREAVKQWFDACLEGLHPGPLEFRAVLPDGRTRVLRGCGDRESFPDGRPGRIVGSVLDVSEYRWAEQRLQESLDRLRLAVQAANIGLWDWDLQTGRVVYSPEWKSQLGYEDHEIGDDVSEWERRVHPDDLPQAMGKVRQYLANPAGAHEVEFRMRHKDGAYRWIYARAEAVRDAAGRPTRMLGCHVDITERKHAEEALRQSKAWFRRVYEEGPVGMVANSLPDGRFLRANRAFCDMLGYTEEGLRELTVLDVKHPDERAATATALAQVLDRPVSLEKRYLTKDGRVVWGLVNSAAVHDPGWPPHALAIVQDITERKRAEQELRKSREQLQRLAVRLMEAEEALRRQAARELHDEVGQSLSALGISLSILGAGLPPDAAASLQERVDDALALLQQTAERIRNVMTELYPPVLVDYRLEAALRWYGPLFAKRAGLEVQVQTAEVPTRLELPVRSALFRIAQEALNNAAKHAHAHRVVVSLTEESGRVRLAVADDGVGFDPVAAAEDAGRRTWGLLTMTERAQAVGASLRVESQPGQGATVVVEVDGA